MEAETKIIDPLHYQLLQNRNYTELVLQLKEQDLVKSYDKMKLGGIIYKVGQIVQLSIEGNREKKEYGQLQEFVNLSLSNFKVPLIKIKKYISKQELPQKTKEIQEGISDFELFPTDSEDWLFCTSIDHEIHVVNLKQYEEQTTSNERTYFSRAEYNIQKDKFIPPLSKWGRICTCNQISNPDKSYIQCEKCLKWLHYECAGVQANQVSDIYFLCIMCKKK